MRVRPSSIILILASTILFTQEFAEFPSWKDLLQRLGILEKTLYWHDFGVSAKVVEELAEEQGLKCISQEVKQWGTKRAYIDCFSTIVKAASSSARNNRTFRNANFAQKARNLFKLSHLYTIN
jgi:hypothetical protein